jgi:hypothetical protein
MRFSELHPCDGCGGGLLVGKDGIRHATFYVVRHSQAMVNQRAAREVVGLETYFGGHLQLAELFAPDPDNAVQILGDVDKVLWHELFLCFNCYCSKPLAHLEERRRDAAAPEDGEGERS